jgi:hypothetical protein
MSKTVSVLWLIRGSMAARQTTSLRLPTKNQKPESRNQKGGRTARYWCSARRLREGFDLEAEDFSPLFERNEDHIDRIDRIRMLRRHHRCL